ncbi:MAG: three-Cys-motif partner protein TcmP [Nitrospiraceae bacterium]|nr:three-Cys-motif partner protein TcmP [Nitrospiraceae bacterium]
MKFDEIGNWSEVKLDIVREYAAAYSRILSAQESPSLYHVYIDAFAGAGMHISKSTGDFIPGSPLNALLIKPPFKEYHLIDFDSEKVDLLLEMAAEYQNVFVHEGDCNGILLEKVFPKAKYSDYRRALCLLDPYGLHLNWEVMLTAAEMKSIEIFLNFPIMDMNMNVLKKDPGKVDPLQALRMTAFWGDESWRQAAYDVTGNLFGMPEKTNNEAMAEAFRQRLRKVAGFKYVPEPIPMRNNKGATVYYLFFASQKPVAADIVRAIFDKYRDKGKK